MLETVQGVPIAMGVEVKKSLLAMVGCLPMAYIDFGVGT